jgi:hypothetical protein
MKVTLSGLRVALDQVALFSATALSASIPVMMLISTQDDEMYAQKDVVLVIVGLGIMAGVVGAAYFVMRTALWFITPEDKTAPLPYGAEEWARTHTASERKAQLNREIFKYLSVAALVAILFFASLSVSDNGNIFTVLIGASAFIPMLLCVELIKRNSARSTAHYRLLKAEKAKTAHSQPQ